MSVRQQNAKNHRKDSIPNKQNIITKTFPFQCFEVPMKKLKTWKIPLIVTQSNITKMKYEMIVF